MANRFYITLALVCALASPAFGAETPYAISGPVDAGMKARVESALASGQRGFTLQSPGGVNVIGWEIGRAIAEAQGSVRCVAVCGSAAVNILLGSRNCSVARSGHMVMHKSRVPTWPDNLNRVMWLAAETQYRQAGVPEWVLGKVEARNQYELSEDEMRRVCVVE